MKKVLLAVLTLALAATGSFAQSGKLVIGFSQVGEEGAWRDAETADVKAVAAARGIDLKFSDGQEKQENQIKAIRSFIAQKVQGIILAPIVETGWEPVLKEAKKAGIPVVLLDRNIKVSDPTLYTTFIGSDFKKEGQRVAAWVATATAGKANIVELQGTVGAGPAIDRQKGFADGISTYAGLKIIKSQSGDFNRAGGKQVMEAFLKSDGDKINVVYAHNDDMAVGAIQAIEAAGKVPGKDILVVSIDGVHDGFQGLIDGKENYIVECNPLLATKAFDAIAAAIKGTTLPKWTVQDDGAFDQAAARAAGIASRKY
jgi:simple sugar transport system substrate-binding protein